MGLFSGSGSWATDCLIETLFSNLSYSEVAAVFGADPFLCLVYDIGGGVLQWIFVTIGYAISLRLKYRGSKIPGRSGGRV